MKEFKGTKQEWVALEDSTGYSVFTQRDLICRTLNKPTKNEACANAKLIATAPELLEVAQRFAELRNRKLEDGKLEGYFEEMQTAWENVEITINKALGL